VIEAALQAVNKGEIEAAASIGMTGTQRMIRIIIPEAVELAIPSLGNNLIMLVKGTSLAFSCAVIEMTAQGKILGGRTYRYFEAYIALGIIYWLITIVLEQGIKVILKLVQVPETPRNRKAKKSVIVSTFAERLQKFILRSNAS
jgi:polar amino acid transport system permease protein